ncbi:hypothetical protein LOTGIDRAFT_168371 [Lottia gigantea]|uniref:CUB domain-containing protein n=1 Tax=Lottia gigantea TaxID=225164 RepID=V4B872_LOTGI|nr:hypothetical protein LOTGIDRAFT_168371 [Lottia gigantea]ESO84879.1 hypothetical protein LOTGIDRAFT_168371 [Lottia gigantea]
MLTRVVFPMLLYLVMVSAYTTKVNYVKRKCGSTIMVSTAERIVLEYDDDTAEEDCEIKLQAYDPYNNYDNINLHLRFLELDLPCAQAAVIIDKFDTTNEIYGLNRRFQHSGIGESVCGDEVPDKLYESNLKKMSINFHKRIPHSPIYDSYFDILVTKVNNGLCDQNKEFECDSGRCVDESLVCDDYYNCDDESDEDEDCFWTVGAIIGVAIGLIVVIALAVIGVVLICRKRKYGRFFRRKQAPPIAKVRSNDQPYFSESTSSLAKQLTPIPYAPSLNPSITPNLSPASQKRAMGSTFKQFNNGQQRDFGLTKKADEKYPKYKRNSRSDEHELKTVSAHVEESDSRRSSDSTHISLNGYVDSKRSSSEPRRGSREQRRQGPRKISDYRNGSSSRMSSSSNQSANKSPSTCTDV